MRRVGRVRGFTLIELVMVILLVGIVAVYAAPRLGALTAFNLSQASSELVEAIRFAQESSMMRIDSEFQLVSGGSDKYRVLEYSSGSTQQVTNPLTGATPFVANATEWSGISASTLNLSFDNHGYPCASVAPCSSPMSETKSITVTVSSTGESRTITIEPLTGYVHVN